MAVHGTRQSRLTYTNPHLTCFLSTGNEVRHQRPRKFGTLPKPKLTGLVLCRTLLRKPTFAAPWKYASCSKLFLPLCPTIISHFNEETQKKPKSNKGSCITAFGLPSLFASEKSSCASQSGSKNVGRDRSKPLCRCTCMYNGIWTGALSCQGPKSDQCQDQILSQSDKVAVRTAP